MKKLLLILLLSPILTFGQSLLKLPFTPYALNDSDKFIVVQANGMDSLYRCRVDSVLAFMARNIVAGSMPGGSFQDIQVNSGSGTFLGGQGTLYNGILTLPNGSGQQINIGMASPDAALNVNVPFHNSGHYAMDIWQSEYNFHPLLISPKGTTVLDQREDYGGHPSALSVIAEGSGSSGNAAFNVTQNGSSGNACATFQNGSVGINTTTPAAALDVNGDCNIDSNLYAASSSKYGTTNPNFDSGLPHPSPPSSGNNIFNCVALALDTMSSNDTLCTFINTTTEGFSQISTGDTSCFIDACFGAANSLISDWGQNDTLIACTSFGGSVVLFEDTGCYAIACLSINEWFPGVFSQKDTNCFFQSSISADAGYISHEDSGINIRSSESFSFSTLSSNNKGGLINQCFVSGQSSMINNCRVSQAINSSALSSSNLLSSSNSGYAQLSSVEAYSRGGVNSNRVNINKSFAASNSILSQNDINADIESSSSLGSILSYGNTDCTIAYSTALCGGVVEYGISHKNILGSIAIGTNVHGNATHAFTWGNGANTTIGQDSTFTIGGNLKYLDQNNTYQNTNSILTNINGDGIATWQQLPYPALSTTDRLALTPIEGQPVYDITLHKLYVFDGSLWQACW